MLDTLKDIALVLGRIATIFPLLLAVTLFMGRRSIGELPVFDFLIIIALGSVVGADIADPNVEHLPTAVAIFAIGLLQKLVAFLVMRRRWFGKWVTFEPIVVVQDGRPIAANLRKVKYTLDNILQMLREAGVFDVGSVNIAILEANGKLSVYENNGKSISYPIVIDGRLERRTLKSLDLTEEWLHDRLKAESMELGDVYFASLDEQRNLIVTGRESSADLAPIYH